MYGEGRGNCKCNRVYNTHPIECVTATQSSGIKVSIINYMVPEMCWFSWTRFRHTRNFSSLVHSCTMFILENFTVWNKKCLFIQSIKNVDAKRWCIWIPRPSWRVTINAFDRTCCIIATPIVASWTNFSFPTNKLSKKIRRDLGKYSTFFT